MSLITYLQSIEWLAVEADTQAPQAADVILSELLDLDLSVALGDVIDTSIEHKPIQREMLAEWFEPFERLEKTFEQCLQRYSLALSNWERGRYRVVHGPRAHALIEQEGYGRPDDGSERWTRTGRMIWLSVLEFVETHFKRARMKIRVAHGSFRSELDLSTVELKTLMSLDDLLLRAKLRRLDDSSGWLVKKAQQQFRHQWRSNRPALETREALDVLVESLSVHGWLGGFIVEFGGAFEQILKMEVEAASVLMKAFE
ncbi:MAG: hypothetical protein ACPGQS_00595 [Bradymonadia bacterium]